MDVSQSRFSGQGAAVEGTPADPRLKATPDYGTLGPGSDININQAGSTADPVSRPLKKPNSAALVAAAIGMFAAIVAANIGNPSTALAKFQRLFSPSDVAPASGKDSQQLDRMIPQKQAEALLELAVGNRDGAVEQISSRVDYWRGKVQWNQQIASLTTVALNSDDMRVRESGIEVELAAYGLAKNPASLEYLLNTAESTEHARKIWALWALGLMGNRGVGTEQVVSVLTSHLKDSDEDSRRWAVEGMALTGSTQTIEPLLQTMHDDPSAQVRERAACSLASSGMFTHEQRMSAVPTLLSYAEDPSLDTQTHSWTFHALSDITHQRLGTDVQAWRSWYDSVKTN